MAITTASQLEDFIRSYIATFEKLSSKVKKEERVLLFPEYLAYPHKVKGTISRTFGVAIEFVKIAEKWTFETGYDDRRIEEAVLPKLSEGGRVFFINEGVGNTVANVNLITKDFFDSHEEIIKFLTRATNLIMDNVSSFVKVNAGNLRLINVGLAYLQGMKSFIRKIPCLWLFASNSQENFSPERAKELAEKDYEAIVYASLEGVPISLLVATLNEYQKLLEKEDLKEDEMQKFLENNLHLLEPSYRRVFTRGDLRRFKMPECDLLIKSSDNKYVLVELERPTDQLFTSEKPPNPSKELRHAETQIRDYLSEVRNRILNFRINFPDISVENVNGLIVIGRSSKLTDEHRQEFNRYSTHAKDHTIITYDELFEKSRALLENISLRYSPFR